jgi:hypothetical protein
MTFNAHMNMVDMSFQFISLPKCFSTMSTWIISSVFMNNLDMLSQTSFIAKCFSTLVTFVIDIGMIIQVMLLQTMQEPRFVITRGTIVFFQFFMNDFDVILEFIWLGKRLVTSVTMVIFNFLMDFFDMIFEVIKFDKFSTYVATNFFLLFQFVMKGPFTFSVTELQMFVQPYQS